MTVTNKQVQIVMKEMSKNGNISKAAAKADMCRQTAAKYYRNGKFPSESKPKRHWKTRQDPFEHVWDEIVDLLNKSPGLASTTIFEFLNEKYQGAFEQGQLRTLQRKIRFWRATEGPIGLEEIFFPQYHKPGEMAQTDFTHTKELELTLNGLPFSPVLCHFVLTYSNWEWATRSVSESGIALRHGFQEALYRLGKKPKIHQTDNSTGATHNTSLKKRKFNQEYLDLMNHFDVKPQTTAIGKKEQNGTVEAQNGAFKRYLKQQLLLRGHNDFDSVESFDNWLTGVLNKANSKRQKRLCEELAVMEPIIEQRLPEYFELKTRVTRNSTITVKSKIYSVPPRLIGHIVNVFIYETKIEVYLSQQLVYQSQRKSGDGKHHINYRHVIWSLVKKPRAFENYKYKDDLFPTLNFKKVYDVLCQEYPSQQANCEYLRILHYAASSIEVEVDAAISICLENNMFPTCEKIKDLVSPEQIEVPEIELPKIELSDYDELLQG